MAVSPAVSRKGIHADIQISADQKWIALTKDDYIYVLSPEDKMVDAEGCGWIERVLDALASDSMFEGPSGLSGPSF